MKSLSGKSMLLPVFNLFTSFSTIICCALPALLVTIGAGAALAGLVSAVPQLVVISKYKVSVFAVAGILILITGLIQWKNRNAPCPADPELANTCMRIRKINKVVYLLSLVLYLTGFFFAFIAIHLF